MFRQIIYLLFILILFHFSNASLLAQDTSIVSLSEGNKWYYNYSFRSTSSSGTTYKYRIETKEVVGDTVIFNRPYKIIFVKSITDTNILYRTQYWGVDSVQFYHRNVELVNYTGLNTFYDCRLLNDTLNVEIYQQLYWGTDRIHQLWYGFEQSGGASIYEQSIAVRGIGPIQLYQSGSVETGGISWLGKNDLYGAIIDGIVYGDTSTVLGISNENIQPNSFLLSQNYPNPFNPSTTIKFTISDLRFTTLKVYDILGREIATLVNEEKPAGNYEVEFDTAGLPSGVYLYRIQAGNFVETKKMVLLK